MSELQLLRYQLIDCAMLDTDLRKLRSALQIFRPHTPVRKPDLEIPIMELKSGVTLEEIEAEQTIQKIDYITFRQRINEEEWEQSLSELLKTLN